MRILDKDFDYLITAEVHAFTAADLEARGLYLDADREREIARYLARTTYLYFNGYYTDAEVDAAVESYASVGFSVLWAAYETYSDYLTEAIDEEQATADGHMATAANASRRSDAYLLSSVLMAVAVALGAVALSAKSRTPRLAILTIIGILYAIGLANLVATVFL